MKTSYITDAYKLAASYSMSNENGNRSSVRTDILNKGCTDFLLNSANLSKSDWDVSYEESVACTRATSLQPSKKFTVDIILTHKKTGLRVFLLVKSIEKSYNKNRENFANTTVGEVERLFGHSSFFGKSLREKRQGDLVVFITLLPDKVLRGNKIEKTKKNSPNLENLRLIHKNVHSLTFDISVGEFKNFRSFVNCIGSEIANYNEIKNSVKEIENNINESIELRKKHI